MAIHIQNSKCNESEKKNNFELNLKTGKNNNTIYSQQKLNIRLLNIPIQFYLNKLLFTWVNSVRVVCDILAR